LRQLLKKAGVELIPRTLATSDLMTLKRLQLKSKLRSVAKRVRLRSMRMPSNLLSETLKRMMRVTRIKELARTSSLLTLLNSELLSLSKKQSKINTLVH